MNGMKRKANRLREARRLTQDGLPRDVNSWTYDDWKDLWAAMKTVVRKVKARHK